MSPTPTVAVVGAGLAGLAAAVRLRAGGVDVGVLEAGEAGGKARTETIGQGWRVELGPHTFTHRAEAVHALARELHLDVVEVGRTARARYLVQGGRLRRAGPWTVLSWPLVRGLFRAVPEVPGETVRDWFARRFGDRLADGPLAALCTGIWASSPRDLDMDAAFPHLAAAVREAGTPWRALRRGGRRLAATYTLRGGLGAFAGAARVVLGERAFAQARVDGLTRDGAGWLVHSALGSVRADAVVVATEAPEAATLLRPLAPVAADRLAEVRYAAMAVAHWTAPDAAFPHGFGFLAAPSEERSLLGTLFVSDLFPERCPPGHRAFTSMFGGAVRPDDAAVDEQEARRRLGAEHRALTGRDCTIDGLRVVRHARAVPLPSPGHGARNAVILANLPDGVSIAGAYLGTGAMDDAVRTGHLAAAAVLARVGGRAHAA